MNFSLLWSLLLMVLDLLRSLLIIIIFFLSIWIIIPAPNMNLIPLSVGVPEISAWFILIQTLCLAITLINFQANWQSFSLIVISIISLSLLIYPFLQFPQVNAEFQQQMETNLETNLNLGVDSPKQSGDPRVTETQRRSQPLIVKDLFTGVSTPEVRIKRDITFAQFEEQKLQLNVYQPLQKGKYPTLIVIYGGGWRHGTPDNNEEFSKYIANQGYTVIAIDYRHAPQHQFPIQLEDVNLACQYIHDRADELEVDLDAVAIMGRSAGSQLAMLTGYQNDDRIIKFKAVIGYYGPIDLTHAYNYLPDPDPIDTRAVLLDYLGDNPANLPEAYKKASPINHVKGDLPPSLLIYASRDHIVQPEAGRKMTRKLREYNNKVVYLEIPWADHAFDTVFFGLSNQISLYYTERFLAHTLNKKPIE